jgi:TPR repeat protein
MGYAYEFGYGVAQDYLSAADWYRQAAERDFAIAQYNLALLYENGRGVPQDLDEARRWYQKAADLGDADSKAALHRLGQ